MKETLSELNLSPGNSVVIGSGILQALGIRHSHDIDVIVEAVDYERLKQTGQFQEELNHGRNILMASGIEIGTGWEVLGQVYTYQDFLPESIVIDGVRYITLDFLLRAKQSWLNDADVRPKDIQDVQLIEEYLSKHSE